MKIFFSVGEPSGDLHGANLIRTLRSNHPNCECIGYGGPRMAEAGCDVRYDLTSLAVMWVWHVLTNIVTFWRLVRAAGRIFRDERPDAVVLIDYPGFNWWIARKAKKYGIPVFYYGAPQMWAWASWRVKKMRQLVDHVLCKLPFEQQWYSKRGCNATYVGHPYFDQLQGQQLDRSFLEQQGGRQGPLVSILPGSRTQEVTSNLPGFLQAAEQIQQQVPGVRFAVAAFNEKLAAMAREMIANTDLQIDVHVDRTPELIHLADCCLACSGSVSLELLYHAKPTVILYRVNRFGFWVQSFMRKVKYITLVNLLAADDAFGSDLSLYDPDSPTADQVPMPEYLTCTDKTPQIARHISQWLTDESARQARIEQLESIKAELGQGGASQRAAKYIASTLVNDSSAESAAGLSEKAA